MSRASNKRVKLIESMAALTQSKGYNETALADIAEHSQVPLGNVYYYFKTKVSLLAEVIKKFHSEINEFLAKLDNIQDPRERLQAFVSTGFQDKADLVKWGCKIGSLSLELSKTTPELAQEAKNLFALQIDWLMKQIRAINSELAAAKIARQIIAQQQGAAVLASSFQDEGVLDEQNGLLLDLINNL